MAIDLEDSNEKLLSHLYDEVEMLHAENALKLTQILDLEQLIYDLRNGDVNKDKSPCWCWVCDELDWVVCEHTDVCIKARKATEPFWKK
jgi:hypothetical protein